MFHLFLLLFSATIGREIASTRISQRAFDGEERTGERSAKTSNKVYDLRAAARGSVHHIKYLTRSSPGECNAASHRGRKESSCRQTGPLRHSKRRHRARCVRLGAFLGIRRHHVRVVGNQDCGVHRAGTGERCSDMRQRRRLGRGRVVGASRARVAPVRPRARGSGTACILQTVSLLSPEMVPVAWSRLFACGASAILVLAWCEHISSETSQERPLFLALCSLLTIVIVLVSIQLGARSAILFGGVLPVVSAALGAYRRARRHELRPA